MTLPVVPSDVPVPQDVSEIITKRHIFICDQGHYGSTTCGNCGADVEKYPFRCPQCGFWFERDNDVSYNEGGSDF